MQITKELRTRIDRVFKERFDNMWDELNGRISAIADEKREEVLTKVRAFLNDLNHDPEIRAAVKKSVAGYGEESEDAVVSRYFRTMNEGLLRERDGIKKKVDLEKESLLIAISYSENLEDVKKVFADFGLPF